MGKWVIGRLLLAGILALLVGGSLVVPAAAAPATLAATGDNSSGPQFGVQFHGTWGDYDDAERAVVLDTLRAHGVGTVRIDVSWRMLQPAGPGAFDPWGVKQVDAAIDAAVARGLDPLVTLWMTPEWVTGSADERVGPTSPEALDRWQEFAGAMAQRYAGRVSAWEIWNEPNHEDFLRGADPEQYAQILRHAYAGIKQAAPTSQVVFGGTQYVDTAWIGKVLAAGGTTYDVMGVHPYQGVSDEAPEAADNGTMYRMARVPALYRLMARFGGSGRPVWFTEFGWRASPNIPGIPHWKRGVSPRRQASYLVRTLRYVRAEMPFVTRVYWYTDRADSMVMRRAGYGLVRPDGSPTRALVAASRYVAGS